MRLLESSPSAQVVGSEVRWIHVSDVLPGQTRTFSYRLDTAGRAGNVQAWASVISNVSNRAATSNAATISAP